MTPIMRKWPYPEFGVQEKKKLVYYCSAVQSAGWFQVAANLSSPNFTIWVKIKSNAKLGLSFGNEYEN